MQSGTASSAERSTSSREPKAHGKSLCLVCRSPQWGIRIAICFLKNYKARYIPFVARQIFQLFQIVKRQVIVEL